MIFPFSPGGGILGSTPDAQPYISTTGHPLIAGSSILATLMLVSSQHPGNQLKLALAVLISWTLSAAILMMSGKIIKLLGGRGMFAIERLMGMILVMLSVQMFMEGIAYYQA